MKIIKQSQFVALPPGVLYMHYSPCVFGDLRIKGDSLSSKDWCYTSTDVIEAFNSEELWDRLDAMVERGASFLLDLDENCHRHGLYESDDSLIAVLEPSDCSKLASIATRAAGINWANDVPLPLQP